VIGSRRERRRNNAKGDGGGVVARYMDSMCSVEEGESGCNYMEMKIKGVGRRARIKSFFGRKGSEDMNR
jgi:hypothetical protein